MHTGFWDAPVYFNLNQRAEGDMLWKLKALRCLSRSIDSICMSVPKERKTELVK